MAGCGQKMVAEANWLVWRPSVCCTAAHTPAPSCVPVHSQAELEATQRQLRDADAANRQNATQPAACTCPVPVASPPPAAEPEAANRQDTLAAAAAAAVSRHTGSQAAPAWGLPALRVVSEGRERFAVLLCGSSSLDSLRCHWAAVLLFSSAQRPRLLPPCPSDDHHHGVGLCAGCGHSLPGHPTQRAHAGPPAAPVGAGRGCGSRSPPACGDQPRTACRHSGRRRPPWQLRLATQRRHVGTPFAVALGCPAAHPHLSSGSSSGGGSNNGHWPCRAAVPIGGRAL